MIKKEMELSNILDRSLSSSLKRFNESCDDLLGAKFILAARKISLLLQSIAISEPLAAFFAALVGDYDFIAAFENARVPAGNGKMTLACPVDPLEQIKFVYCMCYAIDTTKLDFTNLLHTFYKYGTGINDEYEYFCEKVIEPFQVNMNGVLTGKIPL